MTFLCPKSDKWKQTPSVLESAKWPRFWPRGRPGGPADPNKRPKEGLKMAYNSHNKVVALCIRIKLITLKSEAFKLKIFLNEAHV